MAIEPSQVVQVLYEMVFSAYLPTDLAGSPLDEPENTVITLQKTGLAIQPRDYQNLWSPSHQTGDLGATKRFSALVDRVSALAKTYQPNGHTVSEIYQQVLGATTISSPPTDLETQQYQAAKNFLYTAVKAIDDESGQPCIKLVPSEIYKAYKQAKAKYVSALSHYNTEYFKYQQTPEGQGTWPLMAPILQDAVNSAYDDLQSAQASKVKDALAVLDRASNQVDQIFHEANQRFRSHQHPDPQTKPQSFVPSYPMPSDWSNPSADWIQASIAQDFTLQFEYALITIDRPWSKFEVFGLPNWQVKNVAPGAYSRGRNQAPDDSLMPLLPQSFVAVRNVKLTLDWDTKTRNKLLESLNGSIEATFGFLLLNGVYYATTPPKPYKAQLSNSTLTFPDIQIIGWINQVVPFSPPRV